VGAARRLLYNCLGLLLVCQLGVLAATYLAGYQPTLIILWTASVVTLLGIVLVTAIWRISRRQHIGIERLAIWTGQVDLTTESLPELDAKAWASTPELAHSVQGLVSQLYDYRDKLLARHQRMQRLLRKVTDILYYINQEGQITWVSDSVTDTLGYTATELKDYPLKRLLADPETDLSILTQNANITRYPTRVVRRDGSIAWLLVTTRRLHDPDGRPVGCEGICRDGTRLMEVQRELSQEKERAQVTLAAIDDGVITTDTTGKINYTNSRSQQMLARHAADLQGQAFESVCRLFDPGSKQFVENLIADCLISGKSQTQATSLALTSAEKPALDRDCHYVTVTVSAIRDEDKRIIGTVVVLHDVTRLERISHEMNYQANHDPLTGLPNRRALENRLKSLLQTSALNADTHILCYLDFDQFKVINDSCGHNAGDEMLRQVSSQIITQLRPSDDLARLGGDEFAIIFESIDLDAARTAVERLRQWLDECRFEWEGKTFRLGASFGLSVISENSTSVAELLRQADSACYLAKESGRNQVRTYSLQSDELRLRDDEIGRIQWITEALDHQGFVLHAQTIVPLSGDKAETARGVELLLRMREAPEKVSPQELLLTAEHYSMASRIDQWVIAEAMRLISRHHDAVHPKFGYYSINISGQSISDEQFVDFLRECIERSGVNPRLLVFEITETSAVRNLQRASTLMHSLQTLGCRFALDDFGSGVSSFNYFKHLPSEIVKIDGKLIKHVTEGPVGYSIIEALCKVSQAAKLKTVAEQVETREQVEALQRIGIDYAQGYYFDRPKPLDEAIARCDTVES
jgi:diguanylate cyclase (GGDEF)-like protein/PAS domain S-box-containing protein